MGEELDGIGVRVWGTPEESAVAQAKMCAEHGNVVQALLMADHHKGYSQPIGGVVVYDGQISPSGVGYDIACGNKAVRTKLHVDDIKPRLPAIMDELARRISFGIGRVNDEKVDHELFDDPDWAVYRAMRQVSMIPSEGRYDSWMLVIGLTDWRDTIGTFSWRNRPDSRR